MKWRLSALAVAVIMVLGVAAGVWFWRVPVSSEQLRRRIVTSLSTSLQSKVELASVELQVVPRLHVIGHELVIRHRKQVDVPLIAVRQFTVSSNVWSLLRGHVEDVVLEGLAIQVPPNDGNASQEGKQSVAPSGDDKAGAGLGRQVVIDRLTADASSLTVLRRDPTRLPRTWRMHQLRMRSVGIARAMPFQSVLTNAVPPGEIQTSGRFGPWNADEPALTPVAGSFVFENANLGVFKGISGTLSSRGAFEGRLERLEVNGFTSTPDFTLSVAKHPVALETKYKAVVDATNGNTALERVEATLHDTQFVAVGGVYEVSGIKGRRVSLTITMDAGRLDDVLLLAVDTPKPTMTGGLIMTSTLELPPGDRDVVDKLRLQGRFRIKDGRFTDATIQRRINGLSGRARGNPETPTAVVSQFAGEFTLGDGQLTLRPVQFDVPGAVVELSGRYGLRAGSLAFAGHVAMDASVSQAVGGWKGAVMKPFDRLFQRNGRTFVPITVSGSRATPKFGLDRGRVFDKDKAVVMPISSR